MSMSAVSRRRWCSSEKEKEERKIYSIRKWSMELHSAAAVNEQRIERVTGDMR